MDLMLEMCKWLEQTRFAEAIQESEWMFPALESVHVLALTIVMGSIAMLDLRLLGLFSRGRKVTVVSDETLPWTWIAFVCAVFSGAMMFTAKAVSYFQNWPFRFKVLLLALAGINMLYFHFNAYSGVASWNEGATPRAARTAAALSLLLWVSIVTLGRWIGFTTK
ncbi:MAG: DUF6644 family protein [Pseudomonadota bacterium]